ncbi:DUF5317 domain-containing protein [Senegalia massiliensis]|uniref:DUF5317 domain-containing protein n=1 Tax=Senegalia massiliensis TaxID=1720316 RepID=UPI00103269F4|nr:DUF5317 domain-containing protein [Senegalia massiliensis]
MIWLFLLLAVIVGYMKGGKFTRIKNLNFKKLSPIIIALVVQYLVLIFSDKDLKVIGNYVEEIYLVSFILIFIGVIININIPSLWIVFVGSISNFIVFAMNGMKIPVSLDALKIAGMNSTIKLMENGQYKLYDAIANGTNYEILGKVITIDNILPLAGVFSVGDILITMGLFVFIESSMNDKKLDRRMNFGFGK